MIRKKLLSVCLALALCLSLLPTMALADDTHSDHAVCVSEGNCTNSDHADSHGTVTWTGGPTQVPCLLLRAVTT